MLDSMPSCQNQFEDSTHTPLTAGCRKVASSTHLLKFNETICSDTNVAKAESSEHDARLARTRAGPKSRVGREATSSSTDSDDCFVAYRQMIADCVTRKVVIPLQKIDDPSHCMNTNGIPISAQEYDFDDDFIAEDVLHEQEENDEFVCVISDVRGEAMDVYDSKNDTGIIVGESLNIESTVMASNKYLDLSASNSKCSISEYCMDLLETVEAMTGDDEGALSESLTSAAQELRCSAYSDDSASELVIDTQVDSDADAVHGKDVGSNGLITPSMEPKGEPHCDSFRVQSFLDDISPKDGNQKVAKLVIKQNKDSQFSKSKQSGADCSKRCKRKKTNKNSRVEEHGTRWSVSERNDGVFTPNQTKSSKEREAEPKKSKKGRKRESDGEFTTDIISSSLCVFVLIF